MTNTELLEKIVKKQDELIQHIRVGYAPARNDNEVIDWNNRLQLLESDLSALKAMEGEEVSDEDIKVWALCKSPESVLHYAGLVEGAKAHRDGLIPASGNTKIDEVCPDCGGDGIETCTNPDHGLIGALSFHDIGRIGCPCCGHSEDHKIKGSKCSTCNGTGKAQIKEQGKEEDKSFIVCDCDSPEIEDNNLCKRCGGYNRNGF